MVTEKNQVRARKGPVLLITRDRTLGDRVRELLLPEHFEVAWVRGAAASLQEAEKLRPTVVLLDWTLGDDPGCEELVHQLRPRRVGPRVIAVTGRGAPLAIELTGVRAVIARPLDAEELVDLVWRHHHEAAEARGVG